MFFGAIYNSKTITSVNAFKRHKNWWLFLFKTLKFKKMSKLSLQTQVNVI